MLIQSLPPRLRAVVSQSTQWGRMGLLSLASNKKQFRIKVRSSWRFPLSLQLKCTCFSPGPKEKVSLTPSQWQYVKYHLHRASVIRLACTMLKGTVIYESWPCKSPLCSSQCVSILSQDFHGSFDIKINSDGFIGKPSAKQGTSGECEITTLTVTEVCGQSPQEACVRTQVAATCLILSWCHFQFQQMFLFLSSTSFPFASHWLRRLSQYFEVNILTPFNSYGFSALPLSSLRGWHASLHSCWRKLLRSSHHCH